jgi:hypothetical protein
MATAFTEIQKKLKHQNLFGAIRYLFKKAILIFLTIFVGTFITIVITNRPVVVGFGTVQPQLDTTIQSHVEKSVRWYQQDNPFLGSLSVEDRQAKLDEYREQLIEESGLTKPYLEKHLFWTLNARRFADYSVAVIRFRFFLVWFRTGENP